MRKSQVPCLAVGRRASPRLPAARQAKSQVILFSGLWLLLSAFYLPAFAQEAQKPDPLAVTELERLRYENAVTRLQLVRLQKDALEAQYRRLLDAEGTLQKEIPEMLREILKAHEQPGGTIDWDKRRVIPKPEVESPKSPASPLAGGQVSSPNIKAQEKKP